MSTAIQRRRGTTAEHASFAGLNGELTVDTDKEVVVVHDGATAGGYPLMRENGSNSALALGSAGTPSLKFTGDTNTGIYSPGADQVAISTGGSGRLFVDANGNVGVGTSSISTFGGYTTLEINNGTNGAILDLSQADVMRARFVAVSSSATIETSGSIPFLLSPGGTEKLRVTSAGLVGIGTSSPSNQLTVQGTSGQLRVSNGTDTVDLGTSGSSAYLGSNTNVPLYFYTNNTTRMYITSGGNVGIGTTAPSQLLELNGASNPCLLIKDTTNNVIAYTFADDSVANFGSASAHPVVFRINNNEAARIDTSNRLLVGTSTGRSIDGINAALQLEGTTTEASAINLTRNVDSTSGAFLQFAKSRGASNGSSTIVQNVDTIGLIQFAGADGTDVETVAASIRAQVDGTPGANDMPGRLVFSTTADGASSPTERMRILSTGETRIPAAYTITTANAANVYVFGDGALARSTSSQKYKTQVEPIEYRYSTALLGCEPVWYRSTCDKDNGNWGWWGFIAEEVAKIDPRLVHWKTTEPVVQENGSIENVPCEPEPEGVAYDRFVPHLLNLIKRQQQAIETLQAKVAALESA